MTNSIDPDEVALNEPSLLGLRCLQIQRFLFLSLKKCLRCISSLTSKYTGIYATKAMHFSLNVSRDNNDIY